MDNNSTVSAEGDNDQIETKESIDNNDDIETSINNAATSDTHVEDDKNDDTPQDKEQKISDDNNNILVDDMNTGEKSIHNESEKESLHDNEEEKEMPLEVEQENDGAATDNEVIVPEETGRAVSAPTTPNTQTQENQENDKTNDGEPGTKTPETTTATTLNVKSAVRKHTTTPADDSGLIQPTLPAIPRGQAKVQQIASSISDARIKGIGQPTIYPIRSRVPPKLIRLATVTVSPAKTRPAVHGPSLYYEEPKRPQKIITWEQANNARPPLRIDMEGPGPCSYSPLNKPLNETNAPSYTFGSKCFPEKPAGIGARTSWGKSWFQSNHPYHHKADYVREGLWPSPTHYPKSRTMGVRQSTMYEAPSFTFGHKQEFSIVRPGAHKEPSPTDYERQTADKQVLKRGPSFSHQFRREGTVLWGSTEINPGPAAYNPNLKQRQQKPAFTIQGIRRSKSHILGPYSTM